MRRSALCTVPRIYCTHREQKKPRKGRTLSNIKQPENRHLMRCNKSCLCAAMKRMSSACAHGECRRIWRKFPFAHRFGILCLSIGRTSSCFAAPTKPSLEHFVPLELNYYPALIVIVLLHQQQARRENFKVNISEAFVASNSQKEESFIDIIRLSLLALTEFCIRNRLSLSDMRQTSLFDFQLIMLKGQLQDACGLKLSRICAVHQSTKAASRQMAENCYMRVPKTIIKHSAAAHLQFGH